MTLGVLALLPLAAPARVDAAVTASVVANQLVVIGDNGPNQITVRSIPFNAGRLEVLDGLVSLGSFLRSTFSSIAISGLDGDDVITLSGPFPILEPATIDGGRGKDTISGGAGSDSLIGGQGNDRFIWNIGSGSDVIDSGTDTDTVELNGSSGPDVFILVPNPTHTRTFVTVGADVLDVGFVLGDLIVNAGDGADVIHVLDRPPADIVLDGGPGNDDLQGGDDKDVLLGGPGNDQLRGGQLNDTISGGAGDDIIFWQGDGNDDVDGGDGVDTLSFFGSEFNEQISVFAVGDSARIACDIDGVLIVNRHVEHLDVHGQGGADKMLSGNGLEATGVTTLAFFGGLGADIISGSDGPDILNGEGGSDIIAGGPGDDQLSGGPANDLLEGGEGNDTFFFDPAAQNDLIRGQGGVDVLNVRGDEILADAIAMAPSTQPDSRVRVELGPTTGVDADVETIVMDLGAGADRVTIAGVSDEIDIRINAGTGPDVISTTATSRLTLDGDTQIDQLSFDALDQPVSVTPGSIAVGGVSRVTHRNVEDIRLARLLGTLPTLSIQSPTADPATTATTTFLKLAGIAADAEGLASVSVTNDRGGSAIAEGTAVWAARNVPLSGGTNVLTATVRDAAGNEVSDTLTVTVSAFTYTMAEGATGAFFDTDVLIANTNLVEAPVAITYLKGDGVTVSQSLVLAPSSRLTIEVDTIPGLEAAEVSATVTSTTALPLVVERTMRWDTTGYGAHTEKATDGPATTWLFAEGSQGFFETFLLLANPQPTTNRATVTFLPEDGPPIVKTFTLAPTSRQTIAVNSIREVVNRSFGMAVVFDQPGAAERAMYFGARLFEAGHESAGVNEASTRWFLAEGATGSFFTTFVLLANPGAVDATTTVTFLPEGGVPVTKTKVVPAGGRVTLNIATEDASLASRAVATAVQSTQPILVERAQYWPNPFDHWYEAHNSFGSTAIGTKWGLAEGRVGGPQGYQTFILLANAATEAADVRITFLRVNGTTVVRSFTVAPASRLTVRVNDITALANESFGALVEVTNGPGIFVERALYSDSQGVAFAAGTNALATRLP